VTTLDAVFDSPLPSAPLAELRNHTPFPVHYFQTVDPAGQVFHVVVVRVTCNLRRSTADGSLAFADEQTPIVTSDACYGEPGASSVKWESDLAPFKPACDVLLVNATAHAPEGRPLPRWPVAVSVGEWRKQLIATGPRRFERRDDGSYALTSPEAATHVPLRYEFACGGERKHPDPAVPREVPELWLADERNPVGRGFMPKAWLDECRPASVEAPQIELPDPPFAGQSDYPPAGFGAIGRAWLPRRSLAGTYDLAWREQRWPRLPLDHDYRYWNCAPADQQIPYPASGERMVLEHLHPKARVEFALPRHRVHCLVRLHSGPMLPKPLNLDTLMLDLADFRLVGVYRTLVSADAGVRVIEVRLQQVDPS
jgi:hypothetical protein